MRTVKSSSLPKIIKNPHHHFPKAGKSLKLDSGFKEPSPGPTFPNEVAAPPIADSKSKPINANTSAPMINNSI